jgi:hypothetical protein
MEFGYASFLAENLDTRYWKFPGLTISKTNTKQGMALIDRGIVLSNAAGNRLGALVMYNGDAFGSDSGTFFGTLTLYSPVSLLPNVFLASGDSVGTHPGASSLRLLDESNNPNFTVDTIGEVYIRGRLFKFPSTVLIDSSGNWVSGISTSGALTCGNLTVNGTTTHNGQVNASGYAGSFASLSVSGNITCGSLTVTTFSPANITTGTLNVTNQLQINGVMRIDSTGVYRGSLQFNDHVYAGDFGIMPNGAAGPGGALGVTRTFTVGGVTITVYGGIICGVSP